MPEPQFSFQSFDSIEDAFEFMRKGEDYGNRNLHPKQAAITWGDYWVRFHDVAERMVIFGRIETEAEVEASESQGIENITDPEERDMTMDEVAYTMETIRNSHDRGLMWGWAHSKEFTDLGSTHRFNMWPISRELFEAAKAVGWDVDALPAEHRPELEQAWQEYRHHMLAVIASGDQP